MPANPAAQEVLLPKTMPQPAGWLYLHSDQSVQQVRGYSERQLQDYATAAILHDRATRPQAASDGEAWIPVADRLPAFETPVWLFDAVTGSIWIGGRGDGDDCWLWCNAYHNIWRSSHDDKWESDLESDDDYNPTHWMALPEKPTTLAAAPTATDEGEAL